CRCSCFLITVTGRLILLGRLFIVLPLPGPLAVGLTLLRSGPLRSCPRLKGLYILFHCRHTPSCFFGSFPQRLTLSLRVGGFHLRPYLLSPLPRGLVCRFLCTQEEPPGLFVGVLR